ncbi:MAG: alpha/beta hydrolase [Myxococcota bacterium]
MSTSLSALMDEVGLNTLVDQFLARVRYVPDRAQLPKFLDPARLHDARVGVPEPPPLHVRWETPTAFHQGTRRLLRFESPVATPFPEDRAGVAELFSPAGEAWGTVMMVHGGLLGVQPSGADLRPYLRWALALNRVGLRMLLPRLPRHLERTPAGAFSGERFLSGNLLETIDALQQGAHELEGLIHTLLDEGLGPVGLVGMSLGGLTSIQLLAVEERLSAAMLLSPVPDAARSVFDSVIGKTIKHDWQAGGMSRADLEAVFASLSPAYRVPKLPSEALLLVGGQEDEVVRLEDVQRMGQHWGVEVWAEASGHLGLITQNGLRAKGVSWLVAQLRRAT